MENQTVEQVTLYRSRPHFEGGNIQTWIGFKHFLYLLETAVLEHLREQGLGPARLFIDHGLSLEIVESSGRFLHTLELDDMVAVEVRRDERASAGDELAFKVQMIAERPGGTIRAFAGKVKAILLQASGDGGEVVVPAELATYVHDEIRRQAKPQAAPAGFDAGHSQAPAGADSPIWQVVSPGSGAFVWKWRIPYFYCHYTRRLQHSGYIRMLEEVVDLFLNDRGLSIRKLLQERRWIPVVSQSRIELLRDALMEETIHTVFQVEDILKDVAYTARVNWYVERDGALVHTATGLITHGYVEIRGRNGWELAHFDQPVLAALRGAQA